MGVETERRASREGKGAAVPRGALLVLLLFLVQGCSLFGGPAVKTILPADRADLVYFLPDGRRIVHTSPTQSSIMLLDVATGQDVPIPENAGAWPLGDDLLYGEKDLAGVRYYYVVDLRSTVAVRLESLPEGPESLPRYVREADSIYALNTETEKYRLLLLKRGPDGSVIQGYYIEDVRNLDTLLAGIPYRTAPRLPSCPMEEKVASPDGHYYYIYTGLEIYSQQGELLNSISGKYLHCYGWAWDSSGVYVQEVRGGMFAPHQVGPVQLLLAKP